MARHTSNTVDYFPHCSKSGKTLAILEGRYGAVGYAFWFKLLEALCTHENHVIDCKDPGTWEYLISRVPVDEKTGNEMLDLLSRLGNIDADLWGRGRLVWCPAFIENIKDAYKNRRRPLPEKPFLPVETPIIDPISTEKNAISTGRSTQNKAKQNKTKQRGADALSSVVIDPLYHRIESGFLRHNGERFTNYGKEGAAIHGLIEKARARDAEHAEDLLVSVCAAFWKLKEGDRSARGFWRSQPFLPSALNASSIWDRVLESMRRDEVPDEVKAIIAGGAA